MKKFKKLLACICFALIGCFALTGCSLTAEQQNALDVITNNTETLVGSVDSYLDGVNSQISKEKAVEIISRSRLNFLMSNFNEIELNVNLEMHSGFEDQLLGGHNLTTTYYVKDDIKIQSDTCVDFTYDPVSGEKLYSAPSTTLKKSDFGKNIHYNWSFDGSKKDPELQENFAPFEYSTNMWSLNWLDMFGQVPISYFGEIQEEDIYNIKAIEDGYEFSLVTNVPTLADTKLDAYKEDDMVSLFYMLLDVKIVGDYVVAINFKGVQIIIGVSHLLHNETDILLDSKGMPTIDYMDETTEVVTMKADVNYQYENINKSEIEAKIAEVEAKYLTQE